ncbi:MAG: addiction module protein [Verrucomicrobia bacterium]|nr:addiction module protein [Verrucomicrobiota bacterium]
MLPYKYEIREYTDGSGSPFSDWFNGVDAMTAGRIDSYVRRMENGNFGDSKPVGGGVQELRMHFGAGYRVYYGRDGDTIIILLGGGSKRK